jgi:DNA polymerase-4
MLKFEKNIYMESRIGNKILLVRKSTEPTQEKLENSVRLLGISLSNLNTEKNGPLEQKVLTVQLKFDF